MVYDGAMGTSIQKFNPTLDDYWARRTAARFWSSAGLTSSARFTPATLKPAPT